MTAVPVIAIDGPSASGKGTVAQRVAKTLSFHHLDSGALYRLVALAEGASEDECRTELASALEDWVLFSLRRQRPVPTVEGIDLAVTEVV